MRKWKCNSLSFTIPAVLLFLMQVAPAIFGYQIYHKYHGWEDLTFNEGIFLTVVFIAIHLFGKYICIKPKVLKCLKCNDVFCETEALDKKCPICKEALVDIKELYRKTSK